MYVTENIMLSDNISGGEDDEIVGTNAIKTMYDSEGNLEYIELGKALLDYKLRIIPEGIAWVWTWGTKETHILYR